MEKGRKKETEAERGRERKIHIISTIRTFHSSRRYSTLHFFPLPSYLSLAFIFLSFFFLFPYLSSAVPKNNFLRGTTRPRRLFLPPSPHRRPPIDIFKRKAGTMRGFSCIIVASSEISFFLRTSSYNYAFLGKGKKKRDREREERRQKKKK